MTEIGDENWREERLKGFSRVLRLGLSGALIFGSVVLLVVINAELRAQPIVLLVLAGLFLSGIYDIVKVFRAKILWNEMGIRRVGVFREGRLHLWQNLVGVERAPHQRASVLNFGVMRRVPVPWTYKGHREIVAFAKAALKDAKSRKTKMVRDAEPVAVATSPESAEPSRERIEPRMTGDQ